MPPLRHLASQSPSMQPHPASMARLMGAVERLGPERLGDFSLRMANHGLSVSSSMMRRDPRYALEQLHHAHSLPDQGLREMASGLAEELQRHADETDTVS
ncbi:hypothetical protein [Ramlibacter rhizophilus]|uniref:Uncharacterized protein n=1 Tax=Ramlibacter rhizophilus TaxID=1781167 RepID=A0A4Z0BIX5_9BURK|nr:hypothetical protein [Ramlibacter rhizophilus]TFY98730.1 hypothetical protein EZ242_14530 [Ramlibacter rhizophilus]